MREFVFAGFRGAKLRGVLASKSPEGLPSLVVIEEPDDVRNELRATSRLTDDEPIRQLALEWVGLRPEGFFLDARAKIAKLQDTFEMILSEST